MSLFGTTQWPDRRLRVPSVLATRVTVVEGDSLAYSTRDEDQHSVELPDEFFLRELLDLNVLDLVRFSIDGGSREKYEEIRRGAKWDAIEKNVRDFCGLNMARAKTGAICLIEYGKPCTTDWMTDEFKSLLRLLDHVELRHPHDWIGKDAKVKADGLPQKPFKNSCYSLKHGLTILPNGDVTVCCGDL